MFDDAWWESVTPAEIAGMWEHANSWRVPDTDRQPTPPFDRAAERIDHELRQRVGLDPAQLQVLAAVQELEARDQAAAERPAGGTRPNPPYENADRREQLRARLAAAGVPEGAIDARTLADVAQGREPAQAVAQTGEPSAQPRPRPTRNADRDRRPQRVAR